MSRHSNEDIKMKSSRVFSGVIDGKKVELRPYITTEDEPFLIWQIGERSGNQAKPLPGESKVSLPSGVRVSVNGSKRNVITLPQYLSDGIYKDFDKVGIADEKFDELHDSGEDTGEEEDIESMF